MAKKNWVQNLERGGLHRSLGIPPAKNIPESKIAKAAKSGGKLGKQGRAAQTLANLRKRK